MDNKDNNINVSGDSPLFSARASSRTSKPPLAEKKPDGSLSPESLSAQQQNRRIASVNGNFSDDSQGKKPLLRLKKKLTTKTTGENSSKQKIMYLLVPVLAVVFFFVVKPLILPSPAKTAAASTDEAPLPSVKHTSASEIDWTVPEPLKIEIRDPVKQVVPATGMAAAEPNENNPMSLSVRGILFSDDKPSVVIGNSIVHLNDEINGTKVVEINKEYVILEREGKRWTKKVSEYVQEQNLIEQKN
jgi:hypothetical protein